MFGLSKKRFANQTKFHCELYHNYCKTGSFAKIAVAQMFWIQHVALLSEAEYGALNAIHVIVPWSTGNSGVSKAKLSFYRSVGICRHCYDCHNSR